METADFVLKDFGTAEKKELPVTLEISADAVEEIAKLGVISAQQRLHAK
jgi:PTH1 family peptidyl-tRNA hydrolase